MKTARRLGPQVERLESRNLLHAAMTPHQFTVWAQGIVARHHLVLTGHIDGSYTNQSGGPDGSMKQDLSLGSGNVGSFGLALAHGSLGVTAPGPGGKATGVLVLSNGQDDVTLDLADPRHQGEWHLPLKLSYTIVGGTNEAESATGSGTAILRELPVVEDHGVAIPGSYTLTFRSGR